MANDSKTWRCGKYELSFDRPRIMGVLNVTPDSFSDGGEHFDPDAAIEYGLAMLDAGADIIDVGGESTRPGFTPVNPDEEARRVLPVVRALAKEGAIVSIDTRHVAVAKAAVRCGASIVNDVTGFTDPKMVEFVKTSTCGVIVMHAGEVAAPARTHATVQLDTSAAAFVAEKAREAAAEAAREAEKPARRRRGKLLGEPKVGGQASGRRGAALAAVWRTGAHVRACKRAGDARRRADCCRRDRRARARGRARSHRGRIGVQ